MLVEINLLPKKEQKRRTLLVLSILVTILLISVAVSTFLLSRAYDVKIVSLTKQLTLFKQTLEKKDKGKAEELNNNSKDSYVALESAVAWAEGYPVKTVPILRKLISLLPESGRLQTFQYSEVGTVNITVQFETSREAATYLRSLLDCNWLSETKLRTLTANKIILPSIPEVTTPDTINDNENTIEPNNNNIGAEDIEFDENDKVIDYIPRYIGKYELKLNNSVIKKEVKENVESLQNEEEQ
ncbi:MAG: fimbrial assembly family protein [Bacillales bacterium]|jgi:type IV pilus assembly protein PilN|nr:fimbrial assembly family protein [Bacillales bacterium]